jgi:hypothetical protein
MRRDSGLRDSTTAKNRADFGLNWPNRPFLFLREK